MLFPSLISFVLCVLDPSFIPMHCLFLAISLLHHSDNLIQIALGLGDRLLGLLQVATAIRFVNGIFGKVIDGIKIGNSRGVTQGTGLRNCL
jgi:hypothetical protein